MAVKHVGAWLTLLAVVLCFGGCRGRQFYRQQADSDADYLVMQKETDPRWEIPNFDIGIDPRSRYFDGYDPDRPPMPEDDPYSHTYMHCVNGMKGYAKWHRDGDRPELENEGWRDMLGTYVPVSEKGDIQLDIDSALLLSYIHSPENQQQLETIYLSALDVSTERFRLDTQFFGGTQTLYDHQGRLRPGGERNTLTQNSDLTARRRFATAGELLVGFANSFVWQFAGPDTNASFSILNFSLVQPLLRGGGRDVALEQLTIVERGLLANLRAYQRYREGFYTRVAIGDFNVTGPQRRGGFFGGTGLTGFTGQGAGGLGGVGGATGFGRGGFGTGGGGGGGGTAGFAGGGAGTVGGFIGLLQQLQEIRNTQVSLASQLRTLSLLEAHLAAGVIDLTQVDTFRQNIETERANLLQAQNNLATSLDTYKTATLGLPPDLPIELLDDTIQRFQFIDPATNNLQNQIVDFQDELGRLADDTNLEDLAQATKHAQALIQSIQQLHTAVEQDLLELQKQSDARLRYLATDAERRVFDQDKKQQEEAFQRLEERREASSARLNGIKEGLNADNRRERSTDLVIWARDLLTIVQEDSLVQARARLESVVLEPIQLNSEDAMFIAVTNRLDLMNNRANLVDSWRLITFNADALQSVLNVTLSGDMRTVGDNPVKFRAPNSAVRAGLEFDAPFTRLLERNNYRQSLIDYQRDRRQLIQFEDSINQTLRQSIRQLEQLRVNLEIQRRAVAIAIRRVDLTREELNEPAPPAQPGQTAPQFGPTAALNLLTALSDLRNTQNNFMSVWLNYYSTRMRLMRELGVMELDEQGRWIDTPIPDLNNTILEEIQIPPSLPPTMLMPAPGDPIGPMPVVIDAPAR